MRLTGEMGSARVRGSRRGRLHLAQRWWMGKSASVDGFLR